MSDSPRRAIRTIHRPLLLSAIVVVAATLLGRLRSGEAVTPDPFSSELRWWKGNLHTHSFWSDGDDFPEMIVGWYKDHGYNFLALSDHNVLSEGDRWVDAEKHRGGAVVPALQKYRRRFGPWVEERQDGDQPMVRLKPLQEFRSFFERPGEFLLIQSEEITDKFEKLPVHLNATNLRDVIPPQGGDSVLEVLQRNVDAVLEQRRRTGQPMFVHVNHPNFGWGVSAADLIGLKGEQFFEVHNGHNGVRNYGDVDHPDTERIWDMVLTARLSQPDGGPLMFGLGTDDAHNYHEFGPTSVNPGRGWVVVRATHLTAQSIVAAMERGDFYASTGVRLRDVGSDDRSAWLSIDPASGVRYHTEFIGSIATSAGAPGGASGSTKAGGPQIGVVLAQSDDLKPVYEFTGRELYVRARVRSSQLHANPYAQGDFETAWTQPVVKRAP
jgi:hypothetical protein